MFREKWRKSVRWGRCEIIIKSEKKYYLNKRAYNR